MKWYRPGEESSETQWNDILGVIDRQGCGTRSSVPLYLFGSAWNRGPAVSHPSGSPIVKGASVATTLTSERPAYCRQAGPRGEKLAARSAASAHVAGCIPRLYHARDGVRWAWLRACMFKWKVVSSRPRRLGWRTSRTGFFCLYRTCFWAGRRWSRPAGFGVCSYFISSTPSGTAAALGHDPAVVHVHGRSRRGVLFRQPSGKGQSYPTMFIHAVWRAFLLILLGVFLRRRSRCHGERRCLRSDDAVGLHQRPGPNRNGLYFLFLLVGRGWKIQRIATAAILVGYCALRRALAGCRRELCTRKAVGVPARNGGIIIRIGSPTGTRTAMSDTTSMCCCSTFSRARAVRLQPRRLPDAELHAVAGDNAVRPDVRRVAATTAARARPAAFSWSAAARPAWPAAGRWPVRLPAGQAHLDAVVGASAARAGAA